VRDAMNTRRRQAGLSIIELMISITIGILVLTAVALVFVNTSRARAEIERTSRQIENGRYAIELLSDEIRLAGFFGELNPNSVTLPTDVPGSATTDQCSTDATNLKNSIPLHIQGWADATTGFSTTLCALENYKAGTDIVMIRRAKTCVAGVSGCDATDANKAYVQVSLCADETTTHKVAQGTGGLDLKPKSCTGTAGLREYLPTIFYVSTDNGQGASVPTLKKIQLTKDPTTNAYGWMTSPLVEGIEQFHVEYGLDTGGSSLPLNFDGAVDSYTATPPTTVADWMNVMTVKIWLLARNLETSPDFIDTKTYTLGSASPLTVAAIGDGYRRHVYSSLIRIQNPSSRRETP
jgi:type IV pilus assembly protein PilW